MKRVFACECGTQFARSQEKASHCKSCKVHKYFKDPQAPDARTKVALARDKEEDSLASSLNISEQFDDYSVLAGTVISSLNKEPSGGGDESSSSLKQVILPPLSYVISGEKRPYAFDGRNTKPASMLPPLKKVQSYVHYKRKNEILKSNNFKTEAEFLSNLKLLKYKNVVVILGEDISDKPEYSIYNHANGNKDIFTYESFQENPVALYNFLRKFYFNFHFPTITHLFLKLLNEKNILRSVYTTNVDDLEFYSGISKQKICQINGSLLSSYCPTCKIPGTPNGDDLFLKNICIGEAPVCQLCGNLLVPNIRNLKHDKEGEEKDTRDILRRFETDLIYSDLILIIGVNETDHKSPVCTLLLNKILKINKVKPKNDSLIFINARKGRQEVPAQDDIAPSPCLPYCFNHISTGILDFLYKLDWKASFDLLRKEFVANCAAKSFILPPKMEAEHVVGERIGLPANLLCVDANGPIDFAACDRDDNGDARAAETGTIKDVVYTSVETIYVTAPDKDPSKMLYLLSTDLN